MAEEYEGGTWLPTGFVTAYNATGKPELVLHDLDDVMREFGIALDDEDEDRD